MLNLTNMIKGKKHAILEYSQTLMPTYYIATRNTLGYRRRIRVYTSMIRWYH